MRAIKFRAWDNKNKVFINPANLVLRLDGYVFDREFDKELHNVELEQFTGRIDPNSREVYEGDRIIDSFGIERVIMYSEEHCRFVTTIPDSPHKMSGLPSDIKVIGTIHESGEGMK